MPEKAVTVELCDQKHGELMRGMQHIEGKVDVVLSMLNGNGKPGFRETQSTVNELQEAVKDMQVLMKSMQVVMSAMQVSVTDLQNWRVDCAKKSEQTFWNFVKPALPVFYGLFLYLLWLALDYQFGVK